MWLAERHDIVATDYNGNSHHPTHIREACRAAGYEWAFFCATARGRDHHSRIQKLCTTLRFAVIPNVQRLNVATPQHQPMSFDCVVAIVSA